VRVVSLLPSATEIMFAIGAGDAMVGITHECDYPFMSPPRPSVTSNRFDHLGTSCSEIDRHIRQSLHQGSSIYKLDETLLHELQPDLVLTQELCDVCAVSYAQVDRAVRAVEADIDVLSLEPRDIGDILATVQTVADRCRLHGKGVQVVDQLRARLESVRRLPPPDSRQRVACIEWTDPLMVGGHWVPEMVGLAGGEDVLGSLGQPSRWVTGEEIMSARPNLILLMPCGFHLDETTSIAGDLTIPEVPSWMDSADVFAVDGSSYFSRPGPRIVDGVELLAKLFRHSPRQPLPPSVARVH
jgi:iron complex transport system substrate-binding protein